MSSIFSAITCGAGTHTTSLPSWPTCGWYSSFAGCACAKTLAAITDRHSANNDRRTKCDAFMFVRPLFLSGNSSLHTPRPRKCPAPPLASRPVYLKTAPYFRVLPAAGPAGTKQGSPPVPAVWVTLFIRQIGDYQSRLFQCKIRTRDLLADRPGQV